MERTFWEDVLDELRSSGIHSAVMSFYKYFVGPYTECTVLDLGAGKGDVSTDVAEWQKVTKVFAYDKDEEAMRLLKSTEKIEKIIGGSHISLPFEDETFDVVICRYVLHHLDNQQRAIKEVNRVLKEGGIFLLSDSVLPEHSRDVVNAIYRVREDHYQGYRTYYEIIDMLESSGFQPVLMRPYHYRYDSLEKYLGPLKDAGLGEEALSVLQSKIIRAWNMVDETVKREMEVTGEGSTLSFRYYMIDIASAKSSASGF